MLTKFMRFVGILILLALLGLGAQMAIELREAKDAAQRTSITR